MEHTQVNVVSRQCSGPPNLCMDAIRSATTFPKKKAILTVVQVGLQLHAAAHGDSLGKLSYSGFKPRFYEEQAW